MAEFGNGRNEGIPWENHMAEAWIIDELERRDLTTGLVTMCTGGGMAPGTIIERI